MIEEIEIPTNKELRYLVMAMRTRLEVEPTVLPIGPILFPDGVCGVCFVYSTYEAAKEAADCTPGAEIVPIMVPA